ncbi:hypothetical protein DN594_15740 [Enterobacter cloacae]|uniref:Uncharacterized protein n=1 Tax=Enterobacter roggenkampii TaxID=1812935 RepID=A0ABD7GVZ9_9ENTR|nr:hypothetical protein B1H21_01180 [Enterobacter roggenkampii]AYA13842.1 hypothetical protein AM452_21395 [Enterobacter cloacae]POT93487.1 hypothetical protein C3399_21075 [Enterobacter cloacae complex sp. ECNIH14]RCL21515.1 hypothetical protein C6A40_20665 [Enterobacter sp. GER_MD16_1505_Eko_090]TOY96779.1 hypothetical protein DI388_16295 [Escherichia coli]
MCAVVPCQWRRIIGSYSEVTSTKYKKLFVRSLFKLNAYLSRESPVKCAISRAKLATCDQSV